MDHARPARTPEFIPAPVAADGEHLRAEVKRRGRQVLLARITPEVPADPKCARFLLDWLVGEQTLADRDLREEVRTSLEFLIVEKQEPAPWAYVCHHAASAANVYTGEDGGVFWEWVR